MLSLEFREFLRGNLCCFSGIYSLDFHLRNLLSQLFSLSSLFISFVMSFRTAWNLCSFISTALVFTTGLHIHSTFCHMWQTSILEAEWTVTFVYKDLEKLVYIFTIFSAFSHPLLLLTLLYKIDSHSQSILAMISLYSYVKHYFLYQAIKLKIFS